MEVPGQNSKKTKDDNEKPLENCSWNIRHNKGFSVLFITGGGLSGLYKQNVQNLVAQDPPNVNEKAAEELQGARKSKWRMEIMKDEAQKNQK